MSTALERNSLQGRRHPSELSSVEYSDEYYFTAGEFKEPKCQLSCREVTHEQGRGQMLPAQNTVQHTIASAHSVSDGVLTGGGLLGRTSSITASMA